MTSPFNIDIKEVFTSNTRKYVIYKEWTTKQLLDNLYPLLSAEFNIPIEDIEIVASLHAAAGSEKGPAIEPSDNIVIDLWGEKLMYVAFYVRHKNDILSLNHPPIQPPILSRSRRTVSLSNEMNSPSDNNENNVDNENNIN